ncbi:hypothetical protein ABZ890_40165 [Streptomyces sp. NPDC046984]|uniref:hypothetical protein n=1 Tax=Streptomyces sp. NPDC046984 TaxID=3155138 RepID=UPI0033C6D5FD
MVVLTTGANSRGVPASMAGAYGGDEGDGRPPRLGDEDHGVAQAPAERQRRAADGRDPPPLRDGRAPREDGREAGERGAEEHELEQRVRYRHLPGAS